MAEYSKVKILKQKSDLEARKLVYYYKYGNIRVIANQEKWYNYENSKYR